MNGASWPRRRSAWQHDWLKNRYLMAISKALRVLDREVDDETFLARFIEQDLRDWVERSGEVIDLIESFVLEMSPRVLLEAPSLCCCDEDIKGWLAEVVHALWMARYQVDRWIDEALQRCASAQAVYEQLDRELKDRPPDGDYGALRPQFAALHRSLLDLSSSLEQFPREIRVI
jgi:hypothetical protein